MIDPQPQPHDAAVGKKVAITASLALFAMVIEYLYSIREEVTFIWPRVRTSWYSRFYIIGRYIGLISQAFNLFFAVRMYLDIPTSPLGCRFWFTYQAIVIQLLLILVEGLYIRHLWALFLRSRLILVIMFMFAACQVASMFVSAKLSFPSNKYTTTCMMLKGNPGNAFFSATTLTTNVAIFFMTFWKFLRLPTSWTRQGIGRIMFRDSALSQGAIVIVMLFLMLCSLQVIKPTMSGNITYYWLVCVLWVALGRMIIDTEQLPRDEADGGDGDTWKGTLELTSQIEMGQSMLSLDAQYGSSEGHTTVSGTLQDRSLSTPMTKASQLSPSSGCSSDRRWFGDPPSGETPSGASTEGSAKFAHERPPSGVPSRESAEPNELPSSSVTSSDGDAQETYDCPWADADEEAGSPTPSPPPSSNSEPPPEPIS